MDSSIKPSSTVLLMVDVQPEYWTNCAPVRQDFGAFPERCKATLNVCRRQNIHVVWIRADYRPDRSPWLAQFERLNPGKQVETPCEPGQADGGSLAWESFATPHEGELLLPKPSWSATSSTALVPYLRALGATTVLCCGLITSVCVQHSAFGIFEAGFRTILVADACADRGRARHEAALLLYGSYMYEVIEVGTGQLAQLLGKPPLSLSDMRPGRVGGGTGAKDEAEAAKETRRPVMLTLANYQCVAKKKARAHARARTRAKQVTLQSLDVVIRAVMFGLLCTVAFALSRRVARHYGWSFKAPALVEALLDYWDDFARSLSVGQ